jgi:lipopolysaccharide export LptBFGC system permease protein LptF
MSDRESSISKRYRAIYWIKLLVSCCILVLGFYFLSIVIGSENASGGIKIFVGISFLILFYAVGFYGYHLKAKYVCPNCGKTAMPEVTAQSWSIAGSFPKKCHFCQGKIE